MSKSFLIILFCLIGSFSLINRMSVPVAQANVQGGDCDYVFPKNIYKLDGTAIGLQPGDVVCLESGTRGNMRITNVKGSEAAPITIQNYGGQLDIATDTFGITMDNNSHLRLTGTGHPGVKYGLQVGGAIGVEGLTTNIEIDHIEVYDSPGSGIIAKTDPTCDPATWRENFTMRDVSIHDNYVHGARYEGFYIGFTFYYGWDIVCDEQPMTVFGHLIDGLEVYNNVTENTGHEGIQIHSAPLGNAKIYDNKISQYGQQPLSDFQDNGMQIGSANVAVYNNIIQEGPGAGLIVFGGNHQVFNNLILDAGEHGIFASDQQLVNDLGHKYVNNTIVNPAENGVFLNITQATSANMVKNNLIVNPGSGNFLGASTGTPVDESHNLFADTVAEAQFVNANAGNYRLQPLSPAVDAGTDTAVYGVLFDLDRNNRPRGKGYDIGAYEYLAPLGPLDEHVWLPIITR